MQDAVAGVIRGDKLNFTKKDTTSHFTVYTGLLFKVVYFGSTGYQIIYSFTK